MCLESGIEPRALPGEAVRAALDRSGARLSEEAAAAT
jgi:hypothetical protein